MISGGFFAHKELLFVTEINELFEKTSTEKIQELLNFINQIEMIIFDLLYNGRLSQIGYYKFKKKEFIQKDIKNLLKKIIPDKKFERTK